MARVRRLRGIWLGRRPYVPVYTLQRTLQQARQSGAIGDVVLFLEHPPVITLGRGGQAQNLLVSDSVLEARGVELVRTDRGGDITLHAPGQLVAYPIVDLAPDRCDVRRYVADLTEAMRRVVARHGVASGPAPAMIGLWTDAARPAEWRGVDAAARPSKIGAIGVRISKWVTMHGFALNLTTDLSLFDLIVPCGISQFGVASLESLTGRRVSARDEAERAWTELAAVLDAQVVSFEDRSEYDIGPSGTTTWISDLKPEAAL